MPIQPNRAVPPNTSPQNKNLKVTLRIPGLAPANQIFPDIQKCTTLAWQKACLSTPKMFHLVLKYPTHKSQAKAFNSILSSISIATLLS